MRSFRLVATKKIKNLGQNYKSLTQLSTGCNLHLHNLDFSLLLIELTKHVVGGMLQSTVFGEL